MLRKSNLENKPRSSRRYYEPRPLTYKLAASVLILAFSVTVFAQPNEKVAAANKILVEAASTIEQGKREALPVLIPKLEETRQIYRETGNKTYEGVALVALGRAFSLLKEQQKAIPYFEAALILWREVKERNGEATTLAGLASAYSVRGEKRKGIGYYEQAVEIFRALNNRSAEATTLRNLAAIHSFLGERQRAIEIYAQSAAIFRALGDKKEDADALGKIASLYAEKWEFGKSLELYNQALALQKAAGDKTGQAETLNGLGGLFNKLGFYLEALNSFEQAWNLAREAGDKKMEATAVHNIAANFSSTGDKEKAQKTYEIAVLLRREAQDKSGEAVSLNNLSLLYLNRGETKKALEAAEQSLALYRGLRSKRGEAAVLLGLGNIYEKLDDKQKALEFYQQSLPLLRAASEEGGQIAVLGSLMEYWHKLKQPRLAILYGKLAVNLQQSLRGRIRDVDRQFQQSYLRKSDGDYRYLTKLLIAEGRLSEAHQTLNFFKDQQSFDYEKTASPNDLPPLKKQFFDVEEMTALRQLRPVEDKLDALEKQISELQLALQEREPTAEESRQLARLDAQLKIVSAEYRGVIKQIEDNFRRPSDRISRQAEDTAAMQEALRDISAQTGQKTVAVYQLALEENFHALMITSEGIKSVFTPIKNADLQKRALEFWALLQSPTYDPTRVGKELYDTIFKPLEKELPKDTQTILWSLDGNLRYVPMAALHDGSGFLIERYNHVNFTRSDSERMTRPVSSVWKGMGFGTTKRQSVSLLGDTVNFAALPGVDAELREIFKAKDTRGGILDGDVLPDAQFTQKAMLEALKAKRPLVHIASHFAFRPGDESRSFLLLGDGSAFTLAEMKAQKDLFAGVELLTLSACNTAAQQAGANGRDVDAFFELAQRLGANAVMATLWAVADNSTPWLMKEFYNLKLNKNQSKAEALRQAQLTLLNGKAEIKPPATRSDLSPVKIVVVEKTEDDKQKAEKTRSDIFYLSRQDAPVFDKTKHPPFAHPFYWSPFILFGNWK